MSNATKRPVFGEVPSGLSALPYVELLRSRYELISLLDDYVKGVTRRDFNPHVIIDRFEFQGDHLLVRAATLDVQGMIRWLASESVLAVLQKEGFEQITILRDDSLTVLQI